MAEFEDLQKALAEARLQRDDLSRQFRTARERGGRLDRRVETLLRTSARGDAAADERVRSLQREADAERRREARFRAEHDRVAAAEAAVVADFTRFSDPRAELPRLSAGHPILLLPVRIETRFKQVGEGPAERTQLWVRVYPDDVAVDTFEDMLAEVEVRNARSFWTHIWQAGGVDAEKRAAWRTLVSSHGSGRAFWMLGRLRPLNPADEPVKAPAEHLLIVASDQPLSGSEKDAAAAYWRAVWLARDDLAALEAAFGALVQAIGGGRAIVIRDEYVPSNLAQRPADARDAKVSFLDLPPPDALETQQQPWGRPAQVRVLPERFVLVGYNGPTKTLDAIGRPVPADLTVGPEPGADPATQLRVENGELIVPDALRWMIDFDEAVEKGMAFKVDLEPSQARQGFDQLLVLGVRLSWDAASSQAHLEELLQHHQASRKGLALAPQGMPTNNTEAAASAYSWQEDADVSYDQYFGAAPEDPADWQLKGDGRWLAEFLGVDPDLLKRSAHYYGSDQRDARAMNLALWPATLGYFMDRMMAAVFDAPTVEAARSFFTRFVSGRGALPAIRIGSQPYGILLATAFSRIRWMERAGEGGPGRSGFLAGLYELLTRVDRDWTELVSRVSFVGKAGDPHQVLLDVLGLHPTSAELYNRLAQGRDTVFNQLRFHGLGGVFGATLLAGGYTQSGLDLLARLGFTPARPQDVPEILSKFFLSNADRLEGPIVDDRALSETERIRPYHDNGRNYITWLVDAARTSHDVLRRQEGFLDGRPPSALLYLTLHHALDLGYLDVGLDLHVKAGILTVAQAQAARVDPRFIHVQDAAADAGSPWQYLYKRAPAITQDPDRLVGDFVPSILADDRPYLQSQLEAMEYLASVPTARLERAFVEHLDCCSYRLDAWWLGLVAAQLTLMRAPADQEGPRQGSYVGAFGWLEDLRPENKALEPVELDASLAPFFERPDEAPLERDRTNAGHVLAPSLNHAVTAAVLRNGYLSNATAADSEALAIDLSSRRVRLALEIIDGIRAGQSLGALLGYRLERGLHDEGNLFLDDLILNLRRAFPLVADKTGDTQPEGDVSIEALEARNVVDGLALVERVQNSGIRTYPFGLPDLPGEPNPQRLSAINRQIERLLDVNDAVADLALAESVHQIAQGNYDRAAGTLDAYSSGSFPPIPDVAQTPRSGTTLTHRVGLHFEGGLDPADPANVNPRAKAEPAIARWVAGILPAPGDVVCEVEFVDRQTNTIVKPVISAADLGLMPIDLLYVLTLDRVQAMGPLDDAILHFVTSSLTPRNDSPITIGYTEPVPGRVTFFELAPLVRALRALVLRSRSLMPTDLRLQQEALKADDAGVFINTVKIAEVRNALQAELAAWATFATHMTQTLSGPDAETIVGKAVTAIDQRIDEFIGLVHALSRFGFSSTGIGDVLDWRRRQFVTVSKRLEGLITRWRDTLSGFDALVIAYDNLDPAVAVEVRLAQLAAMERLLATTPVQPPHSTPFEFREYLEDELRPAFVSVLGDLDAIGTSGAGLSGVHVAMAALGPAIEAHDAIGFSLDDERLEIRRYAADLQGRGAGVQADMADRLQRADALVAASATGASRITNLTQAARLLLDADFAILPEFSIPLHVGSEFRNAWEHRADLMHYLEGELGREFPVDEWIYGIARVREKMKQLETGITLADSLGGRQLDLAPLQFPYRQQDAWLALEYPELVPGTDTPFTITEDKLLYSAHFAVPFDEGRLQCGVLVDEWTELIPAGAETAGLAFHYDRPNTEPPQTLLLVTPPDHTGAWQWNDLVDAVRETFALAKKRAVEPAHIEQTAYGRFLPAVVSSVTSYPVMHSLNFSFNNEIQFRESYIMADPNRIALDDLEAVLTRQTLLPTIVMWNRLEGRPRRADFDRALQAELRDALWMLTRQWQMGEFRGDDAGSPVTARLLTRVSPLTAFQPNGKTARAFDPDVPLEAAVEARRVPFETRQHLLSLDLRVLMGRQWLKMVAPIGDFRSAYVGRYPVSRPDPIRREDAPLCAHVESWQQVTALAGRAMDGFSLYTHLKEPGHHAHDDISMSSSAQGDIDAAAARFMTWCERLFIQPAEEGDAWDAGQLEYRFSVEAAGDPSGSVLKAGEYYHGRLDWYNLDLDASAASLGAAAASGTPAFEDVPHVMLPTALRFAGMPNTRWWSFEDGSTNFGDVTPDTHELAKLLMMEFGLVYGNDWFLVPLPGPVGSVLTIRGLAVSNVFGERTWIAAAGQGQDEAWQAWRMFNPSVDGQGAVAQAGSFLLLPTVTKNQEGQPFEDVAVIRDEVANMVWGIETVVPLASGASKRGREAALELRAHIERIVRASVSGSGSGEPAASAPIRYEIMNTVPEHWIPFIPVHREGSNRQIQLQRASLPRIIEGDTLDPPEKVKPRTILLREGLDGTGTAQPYFIHEEEVPRTGVRVYQAFQRARWYRGRVCTWFGVRKMTGRGEGTSGLAFDQVRAR